MTLATDSLTFRSDTHTYYADGDIVPSVTQVLSPLVDYSMVPDFMLNYAADRGTQAHYACELFDGNDLEEETLDERLVPYLSAWKAFRRDSGFQIEANEQRLWNPRHRYAGTVDRVGILNGRRVVLELKTTSQLMPATAVQCSAYMWAFNESRPKPEQARGCVAVHLRPDGSYRLMVYSNPREHFAAFLALRYPEQPGSEQVLEMWKLKHGAGGTRDLAAEANAMAEYDALSGLADASQEAMEMAS
jgi:hypothetical protein